MCKDEPPSGGFLIVRLGRVLYALGIARCLEMDMSDAHTVHTTGLTSSSAYAWMIGATAASIDFVLEAQGLLKYDGYLSAADARTVATLMARVKAHEVILQYPFTVRDLLTHGLPNDTRTD